MRSPIELPYLNDPEWEEKRALREKAIALLKAAGVPLNLRRNKVWFDGKAIAAGPRVRYEDILHEGAHWLVADKTRRTWVNYGLGTDPNMDTPRRFQGLECKDPRFVEVMEYEEVMASGCGIIMVAMIEGDYDTNLRNHSWDCQGDDGPDDLKNCVKRLRSVGVNVPRKVLVNVGHALSRLLRS